MQSHIMDLYDIDNILLPCLFPIFRQLFSLDFSESEPAYTTLKNKNLVLDFLGLFLLKFLVYWTGGRADIETALAGKVMRSVVSVCSTVSTLPFELTDP